MVSVRLPTTAPVTGDGQAMNALNVSASSIVDITSWSTCNLLLCSLLQPFALLLAKTVVYALLPTHVHALLAGLDQFVIKVQLLVYIHCYSTSLYMYIVFSCSYLIGDTVPTSLPVWVKKHFYSTCIYIKYYVITTEVKPSIQYITMAKFLRKWYI